MARRNRHRRRYGPKVCTGAYMGSIQLAAGTRLSLGMTCSAKRRIESCTMMLGILPRLPLTE